MLARGVRCAVLPLAAWAAAATGPRATAAALAAAAAAAASAPVPAPPAAPSVGGGGDSGGDELALLQVHHKVSEHPSPPTNNLKPGQPESLSEMAAFNFPNGFFDAAEDACQPPLAQEKSEDKCAGRGYLVESVTYNVSEKVKRQWVTTPHETGEYCGKCDWPFYGRWCQRSRGEVDRLDVVVVVDAELHPSLGDELAAYVADLAEEGLAAEVIVWDLPVAPAGGAYRELRRLLKGDWQARGSRAAFLVGHFPAVHFLEPQPGRKPFVSLGYYMHLLEEFPKPDAECAKPGGEFVWPGFKTTRKNMSLAVGVLNHLKLEEYKFYFDKLRRWRAGGNRFFNIGPGTGNKPLLEYIDIGSDDPAQPVNDVKGMGAAFHFPEDLDHYRTGTPKGGSKCNGCCKADREPGYNCATREGCTYAGGQAFWPQGYGTKPSVIEADTGPKFVIARWKIHGTSSGTACFSGKRDLRGQPFAGASMIFMWSCSSSKYTVFNLGSVVTTLEFGLNSLGVAPSGAAQEPWLFAQLLREGKAAGEALVGWWHGHGRTQGSQDGFGQAGIVLYGDPMVKYGALVDWEAHRIRRANENATRNMTKQDEKEDSAFLQEGEEEEDEEADAEEEAADAARYDAALNGESGSQV